MPALSLATLTVFFAIFAACWLVGWLAVLVLWALGTAAQFATSGLLIHAWAQLGLHAKALVLVDADGFWDPFVAMLDRMVESGFLLPRNRALILRAGGADEALDVLAAARPEDVPPAIGPEDR